MQGNDLDTPTLPPHAPSRETPPPTIIAVGLPDAAMAEYTEQIKAGLRAASVFILETEEDQFDCG